MNKIKRLILAVALALMPLLSLVSPAMAISNPTGVYFGASATSNEYSVYQDMLASGDMLFVAETNISYPSAPTDYTSNQAFNLQITSTDGATVLFSTPILSGGNNANYGKYVNAIYLTSASNNGTLTWGTAYGLRIAPNPAVLTPVEGTNQRTVYLQASDYWTNTPAGASKTALISMLKTIAADLSSTYVTTVNGIVLITPTGGEVLGRGIPGVQSMAADAFQNTSSILTHTNVSETKAFENTLTTNVTLGTTIAGGINGLAAAAGMPSSFGGVAVWFAMVLAVGGYVWVSSKGKLGQGMAVFVGVAGLMLGVAWGLIPMGYVWGGGIVVLIIGVSLWVRNGSIFG